MKNPDSEHMKTLRRAVEIRRAAIAYAADRLVKSDYAYRERRVLETQITEWRRAQDAWLDASCLCCQQGAMT